MPVAVVTGADSGIGRATAVALAERGFDLGLTYNVGEEGAEATVREVSSTGRRARARQLDLGRAESGEQAVSELADALGGIDVLVNNAGTGASDPVLETSLEAFRTVLEVDLLGAFACAREAARRMAAAGRGGRIVNVTSVHEHVPLRGAAPYVAAKHGLGGLTKSLALELAEHGITVNSVAPGEIATPMTGQEDVDPGTRERPLIPAGRPGDARDVARLIAWLASDESGYVTGASYLIDGGMLLMAAMANAEARPAD